MGIFNKYTHCLFSLCSLRATVSLGATCILLCFAGAAEPDDKPGWVKKRPLGAGYYIGIGSAGIENYYTMEEAEDAALQNAIKEIGAQLKIELESVTRSSIRESSSGVDATYDQGVKTRVQVELTDVEIHDTWRGKGRIWIYARLSKQKHLDKTRAHDSRVKAKVLQNLQTFNDLAKRHIAQRLQMLIEAQAIIRTEGITDPYIDIDGTRREVESYIAKHLKAESARLKVRAITKESVVKSGSNLAEAVEITVEQDIDGVSHPAADIPVRMRFIPEGAGTFVQPAISDSLGIVVGWISEYQGRDVRTVVVASVDFQKIHTPETDGAASDGAVTDFGVSPEVRIPIKSIARVVFFEYFADSRAKSAMQILRAAIKEAIAEAGIVYEDVEGAKQVADLCCRVQLEIARTSQSGNIVFVYLQPQISIYDCAAGSILGTIGGTDIKQGARDPESASIRAVKKFIDSDIGELANQILDTALKPKD
jgi:hypothetical protein